MDMGGGIKMGFERVENDGNHSLSLSVYHKHTLAFLSGEKESVCL
jgi:hypothetical protein